jgi:hypothetical protein
MAQTVLVAILHKAPAGIDHEDTGAARGIFLIDAGGDAGTVEQVGGQTNDALDVSFADDVQQKGIVAIFHGWHAIFKTLIQIMGRVESIASRLIGERRIGYDEVECLEIAVL